MIFSASAQVLEVFHRHPETSNHWVSLGPSPENGSSWIIPMFEHQPSVQPNRLAPSRRLSPNAPCSPSSTWPATDVRRAYCSRPCRCASVGPCGVFVWALGFISLGHKMLGIWVTQVIELLGAQKSHGLWCNTVIYCNTSHVQHYQNLWPPIGLHPSRLDPLTTTCCCEAYLMHPMMVWILSIGNFGSLDLYILIPSKNILKPDCPTFPYTFPILMATKKHINIHIAAPRCSSAIIRPRKYRHFQTSSPSTSTWLIHWQSCDTLKTTIDAFDLDSWNVCIPSHGPNIKYIKWLVVSSKSIANQTISNAWIQQLEWHVFEVWSFFKISISQAFPKH